MDNVTAPVLPTTSVEYVSTRSAPEKWNQHTNILLQHQHDVCQYDKEKRKYEKYQEGLKVLRNLFTTNTKKSFVSAHKNSIIGFCLVNTIVVMDYIQTNYITVIPKQVQDNKVILNAKWDPTTTIEALFTCIEY